MSQEVERFAVKQIKRKTTAVSANQESGFFCSNRSNLSTLSSSSLFVQETWGFASTETIKAY